MITFENCLSGNCLEFFISPEHSSNSEEKSIVRPQFNSSDKVLARCHRPFTFDEIIPDSTHW